MNIIVTGSAGYIGSFFINRLIREKDIAKIIGIDLLQRPKAIEASDKLFWIREDLARKNWQERALAQGPIDAVVHAAFKIRCPYGQVQVCEKNNLQASKNVFEFAFKNKVPKLIYLSSVAAYSPRPENIGVLLKENEPLLETQSPYGNQKRLVEKMLADMADEYSPDTKTVTLRLNSVTGPCGQSLVSKFGLITFLRKLLPFIIEADQNWARQFVHEKDLEEVLWMLIRNSWDGEKMTIFNFAPARFLTARDMGKLLGKRVLKINPKLVRPLFWLAWNFTLGMLPTRPESSDSLIYPINVDGSKIERMGFRYHFDPADALLAREKPGEKTSG